MTDPPTLPVVLAKLAVNPHVELSWGHGGPTSVRRFLSSLVERDLVVVERVEVPSERRTRTYARPTPRGLALATELSSPTLLTGPLGTPGHPEGSPGDRTRAALLYATLVRGGSRGTYGVESSYGPRGEVAHVLACGLDLARSGPDPLDDSWDEWVGDAAEPGRVVGVSGRATCSCGAVSDHEVCLEVTSVSDLVRALASTPW